jgi:hypothetical protein
MNSPKRGRTPAPAPLALEQFIPSPVYPEQSKKSPLRLNLVGTAPNYLFN